MTEPDEFLLLRDAFELERSNDFEKFREKLTARVLDLLLHDTEKLTWILYRVDVPESMARQAFEALEAPLIAQRLADLLIQREASKHETRKSGRGNNTDWLDA